ncbi:hypothetical protein B0H14DRAFT_3728744 [Mycena olivaceomarginata]|nr:hypothetical protein B0H14DRAFT_3728744 [Mycena olivaceomarginata]
MAGPPAIVYGDVTYFSHVKDGRVYRVDVDGAEIPLSPSHPFANLDVYPLDPTILVGVFEDSTGSSSPATVVNSLCFINVSTKTVSPLDSDASFYSTPKFSADGKRLVWVEWDLPEMPWNGTEIWVADVVPTSGSFELKTPGTSAGEHGKISVTYPTWTSNDTILFTCDASGFENPWSYDYAEDLRNCWRRRRYREKEPKLAMSRKSKTFDLSCSDLDGVDGMSISTGLNIRS